MKESSAFHDVGINFIDSGDSDEFLSYQDLYRNALTGAAFLREQRLIPGDELVLQLSNNKHFVIAFWSCILSGVIPVPVTVGQNKEHRTKLSKICGVLNNPLIITDQNNLQRLRKASDESRQAEELGQVLDHSLLIESLLEHDKPLEEVHQPSPDSLAFIQFSSGSTGLPKGVKLTHANLMTNINDIETAGHHTNKDKMFSWMPLTHDMGLIGFHLHPVNCKMNHCIMATNLFIRRPALWLDKVTEHAATILCSPNFGYNYILKHCVGKEQTWDLSSVRFVYNGAEPISIQLCKDFNAYAGQYQLAANAMRPVYGLAEACLAVAFSPPSRPLQYLSVDRQHLAIGEAIQTTGTDLISFMGVGSAVPESKVRIVDLSGKLVEEGVNGVIEIAGRNVTNGYYNNPAESNKVISPDGWLQTGDLGFLYEGELYITGRQKDIIFVNGQNVFPYDVENALIEIEQIELNKVVVAGYTDEELQSEKVIVFVFHRGKLENFLPVLDKVGTITQQQFGFVPNAVIPVKDIPRTTSGKLQRYKLLTQYRDQQFVSEEQKVDELIKASAENNKSELTDNELLRVCWRDVLKHGDFADSDSFFQLGGSSLGAGELSMSINKVLNVEVSIEEVYEHPTFDQMVNLIQGKSKHLYRPLEKKALSTYPLSSAQRGIYYAWEVNRNSTAYNLPVAFQIGSQLDIPKLEKSLQSVIASHKIFHTRLSAEVDSEPRFEKHEHAVSLPVKKIGQSELGQVLTALVKPFDLLSEPLFRMTLLEVEGGSNYLFLDFHHIISDGVSVSKFIDSVQKLYNGKATAEALISTDYGDFVHYEQHNDTDKQQDSKAFWLQQLGGELPRLNLPVSTTQSALSAIVGRKHYFEIDKTMIASLRQLAVELDCTLHSILLTVYRLLLWKYTGQHEVVIGIPVANRNHPDTINMQGMFVNNLPLVNQVDHRSTIAALIASESARLTASMRHHSYPYYTMLEDLKSSHGFEGKQLFDTMFMYQNMIKPAFDNGDVSFEHYLFDPGFSKYALSLELFESGDQVVGDFEYDTALFTPAAIEAMVEQYQGLLKQCLAYKDRKLSAIHLLTEAQYQEFVHDFNETTSEQTTSLSVGELFEKMVHLYPDRIALQDGDVQYSYTALQTQSNRLASALIARGMDKNELVAVLMDRSAAFVISVLGILKAGGAYVLIDVTLPSSRVEDILSQSDSKKLIVSTESRQRLHDVNFGGKVHVFDELMEVELTSQEISASSDNEMAYVLFTSGSTGRPKGVKVGHRSLANYISWAAQTYVQDDKITFPLFTSVSFDLTVTSIFVPLTTGNTIVVYRETDPVLVLEAVLEDNQCDILKLTPSHLNLLQQFTLPEDCKIKRLIVGGEALTADLARSVTEKLNHRVEIFNEYGPTEATVGCMIHLYDTGYPSDRVPIGKPITNSRIYLLDSDLNPVPAGVFGEIFIGGSCLSAGYLGASELTSERFIDNPFVAGERMYRSGDYAVRNFDGVIAYIGRRDSQKKIRGHRVELSEIAHALKSYHAVSDAVVNILEDDHQSLLCAYFIPKKGELVEMADLKAHIATQLPYYMLPSRMMEVAAFPLTQNGKIDLDRLGIPEPVFDGEEFQDQKEREIATVWQKVLNEPNIGPTNNFYEMGGDSVKAVQVASALNGMGYEVSTQDVLSNATIRSLAGNIQVSRGMNATDNEPLTGEVALWPIAEWFFTREFVKPGSYNQSIQLQLNETVQLDLINQVFNGLIRHHDALRLNYDSANNRFFFNEAHLAHSFKIREISEFDVEVFRTREFDLSSDLLLDAGYLITEQGTVLLITMHHLITDGLTWRILLQDLLTFYQQLACNGEIEAAARTHSFQEYATAMQQVNKYAATEQGTHEEVQVDTSEGPYLLSGVSTSFATLSEAETTFLLKDSHEAFGTSPVILQILALTMSLRQFTGQSGCTIEVESHGRDLENYNFSRTAGWFTSMSSISFDLLGDDLAALIKAVKEQYKTAINSNFDRFRTVSNTMTPIRFNYLGQVGQELSGEFFEIIDEETGLFAHKENHITTLLDVNTLVTDGCLQVKVDFHERLYQQHEIEDLLNGFLKNLTMVLDFIRNQDDIHFTPSDFEDAELDQEELDELYS